jgi:hypothetical protein
LSLELSITALAAVRGAAMALGGGAQFLPWWLSPFWVRGVCSFFLNKPNKKRQRKKSKAKGMAKWALLVLVYGA